MIKRIEQFLLSNTSWIYLTALLWFSFLWVMTLVVDHNQFIYLSSRKWIEYLKFAGVIAGSFSPLLFFTFLRSKLKKRLPKWGYLSLWGYSFVVHPLIIGMGDWQNSWLAIPFDGLIIGILAFLFLGLELMQWLSKQLSPVQQFVKMDLEKMLLGSLIIFALFHAFFPFPDHIGAFFLNVVQYFLFLLIYYFFYRINHYFLVRRIYKEKGLIHYSAAFMLLLLLFSPVVSLAMYYLPALSIFLSQLEGAHWVPQTDAPDQFRAMNIRPSLLVFVLTIPFTVAIQWFRQRSEIATLEKKKSDTELSLLKQQINPHFFFNTLNNLYALSMTRDTRTPEVIMQLSELMRYVIYKGKEEQVPIADEIQYIEDYVRLQQIRLHQVLDFRFDQKIDDPQLGIPPLLFIILVENAFKHGIEPAEQNSFLYLRIETQGKEVIFSCENSYEPQIKTVRGLGLDNLRRRLALRFPNQHQLIQKEKETAYQVFLKFTVE